MLTQHIQKSLQVRVARPPFPDATMNIDHVVVPSVLLHPHCHFSYFAKAQIGVQFFYPNPVLTWHMVTPGIAIGYPTWSAAVGGHN